jgi:hypothetical protein
MNNIYEWLAQKISTKKEVERQKVWPFLPSWRVSRLFQPHQLTRIQQILTDKQPFLSVIDLLT